MALKLDTQKEQRLLNTDRRFPLNENILGWKYQQPTTLKAHGDESLLALKFKANLPFVHADGNLTPGYLFAKRFFDIVGALFLILFLSPILVVTYITLFITTKGNPLFIQERIGHLGRRFPMLKFRTMQLNAEAQKHLVENKHQADPIFKNKRDPRITPLGAWLRKLSIDETPQLFNVLVGQMSLVGPRPPIETEVAQYTAWHRQRLSVKPGLTCLWQVNGRSDIGFEDWVNMDIWYIRNQNLLTDFKLLLKTPWSVLTGKGAY
ncbi:MAG: sugar transferase [Pirellulaceae bacterium]|nr:sugar transferase [Pirellulaceae bacterium]